MAATAKVTLCCATSGMADPMFDMAEDMETATVNT
ncbi:Uncharacterised protein [Mycobacteroides abscessus subsp. abscessus]|nr:Uncharacterised protein [Mycobacteroides abscessus subsp. abscessus]SKT57148.1 Uncharacterised protein [Mycobacteroides abscessus subsp. abscessus]